MVRRAAARGAALAPGIAEAKVAGSGAPYAPLLSGIRSVTATPGGAAATFTGNGPYRLGSRVSGERIVLKHNSY